MFGCSGHGEAIGHAGELVQGALRLRGSVEPFLITIPAPTLIARASATAADSWSVRPVDRTKALRAARLAAEHWGWIGAASVEIESPIPVGRGFGSSTADCTAAIRAMAALAGVPCPPAEIAGIAVRAEGACDSTMFGGDPIIWLPERGEALARLDGGWPALCATAFDLGGPAVDTHEMERPVYTPDQLDEFERLLETARYAFAAQDLAGLGRVASASATIHRRRFPRPGWDRLLARPDVRSAAGVAAAHSGTIATVLGTTVMPGGTSFSWFEPVRGADNAHLVCGRR